jgi:hypothetical protein
MLLTGLDDSVCLYISILGFIPTSFYIYVIFPHSFFFSPWLGAFAKLRKATISFVMSICPSTQNNSARTGRIAMKFDVNDF